MSDLVSYRIAVAECDDVSIMLSPLRPTVPVQIGILEVVRCLAQSVSTCSLLLAPDYVMNVTNSAY